jgi:hypothetical protein
VCARQQVPTGCLPMNSDPGQRVSGANPTKQALSAIEVEVDPDTPKLSFRHYVGKGGIALTTLPHFIGVGHIYIASELTNVFTGNIRSQVWPFLFMALFCFVLPTYNVIRWKSFVTYDTLGKEENEGTGHEMRLFSHQKKGIIRTLALAQANFEINGALFLWKLNVMETVSMAAQVYNLVLVYTCTLPPDVVAALCAGLALHATYLAFNKTQKNSAPRRDMEVTVNLLVSLSSLAFPLSFMWFAFQVPLASSDLLLLTAWPTISVVLDIDELFQQRIQTNHAQLIIAEQKRVSFRVSRRRLSIFKNPKVIIKAEKQEAWFPKSARYTFAVVDVFYGIFFVAVGIIQLSSTQSCRALWETHCLVQVPYCKSLFRPRCNCAVLLIKEHNMTTLPTAFGEMTALRSATVSKGPLTTLPDLTRFTVLSMLNVKENALSDVAAILKAKRISILDVSMNRLERLPDGLDALTHLFDLHAEYNSIRKVPSGFGTALRYVRLHNNSLTELPVEENFWGTVEDVSAGYNKVTELPRSIQADRLLALDLPSNNISTLPAWIGHAPRLNSLDVRNNRLAVLPKNLNVQFLWIAGNPVCTNNWLQRTDTPETIKTALTAEPGKGCTTQCSQTCVDIWKADGICDYGCNNAPCKFDGGDCAP